MLSARDGAEKVWLVIKFLLWAAFSLLAEITFDDVFWIGAPMGAGLVLIIALDVYDDRKQRRRRRSGL